MDTIVCRFYGRFLVAATGPVDKPHLTFLMPNMPYPKQAYREHRPLMTIAKRHVAFRQIEGMHRDEQPTTLAPSYRILAGADPKVSEQFVWDLTGWTADLSTTGGVQLTTPGDRELIELGELERLAGRPSTTFDKRHLKGTRNGPVTAAVQVGGGVGRGHALFSTPPNAYVRLDEAKQPGAPKIVRPGKQDIDVVDITVATNRALRLAFVPENGGAPKYVTVDPIGETVISFTNLCVCLPEDHARFDFEFEQYYNVLTYERGKPGDVLIPHQASSLGYDNCDNVASIWY